MRHFSTTNVLNTRQGKTIAFLFAAMYFCCGGLSLIGCGNANSTLTTAQVRSFNAYVPTSGDASVSITSGTTTLSGTGNLAFGQFANGGAYISLPIGTVNLSLSGPSFTTPVTSQATLAGAKYTLVAAGQEGQTGTLAPQLIAIPDYTVSQLAIPLGSTGLRVINLSLNTNPIGLYTTTAGAPGAALATGLGSFSFGYSSTNTYVAVPITPSANLALVDTTATTSALPLSSTSNLTKAGLLAGQAYTLYIYGQSGSTTQPLGATWVQDYP